MKSVNRFINRNVNTCWTPIDNCIWKGVCTRVLLSGLGGIRHFIYDSIENFINKKR